MTFSNHITQSVEMVIKKVMKSLLKNVGISNIKPKGEQDNVQTSNEDMDLDIDSFEFKEVPVPTKKKKVVDDDHDSPYAKVILYVCNLKGIIAQLSKFCGKKMKIDVLKQVEIKRGNIKIYANDFSDDDLKALMVVKLVHSLSMKVLTLSFQSCLFYI